MVFPSQFTRERPDAPDIPGKEVTFAFEGPVHNIYATLAVRLSHSTLFTRKEMWHNAASYEATVDGLEEPAAPADVAVAEMNRSANELRDRNAAGLRLKGKVETGEYDVFLCYSSRDRKQVMAIGERLRERGIRPWLDNTEIRPGTRWQQELRKRIKSIRSAAVFIGPKPGPDGATRLGDHRRETLVPRRMLRWETLPPRLAPARQHHPPRRT